MFFDSSRIELIYDEFGRSVDLKVTNTKNYFTNIGNLEICSYRSFGLPLIDWLELQLFGSIKRRTLDSDDVTSLSDYFLPMVIWKYEK